MADIAQTALARCPESAVYRMAQALLADTAVEKVAYGTEASFFQDYGVPSITCMKGTLAICRGYPTIQSISL